MSAMSVQVGLGVFAREAIKAGTYLFEYAGTLLSSPNGSGAGRVQPLNKLSADLEAYVWEFSPTLGSNPDDP